MQGEDKRAGRWSVDVAGQRTHVGLGQGSEKADPNLRGA